MADRASADGQARPPCRHFEAHAVRDHHGEHQGWTWLCDCGRSGAVRETSLDFMLRAAREAHDGI